MIREFSVRGTIPMATVKSALLQLLRGLQYLHSNWIIHRDLKPQNVLVMRSSGVVKVGDFGLARLFQAPLRALSEMERVVVTLWYRAPELLLGAKHYNTAVDVWALGCIFGEMLLGQELFRGKEDTTQGAMFQADQCDKVFRVLGVPTKHAWPKLGDMPLYQSIDKWDTSGRFPASSQLHEVVGLQPGCAALDLLSRMLTFGERHSPSLLRLWLTRPESPPPPQIRSSESRRSRPCATPSFSWARRASDFDKRSLTRNVAGSPSAAVQHVRPAIAAFDRAGRPAAAAAAAVARSVPLLLV